MAATFSEAAREDLAAFLEAQFPAALAAVEAAQSLAANSLGRPKSKAGANTVVRGFDPSDLSDGKVEVYVLTSKSLAQAKDRTLFQYEAEVSITLFSNDAQVLPVQTRLSRWESAWWSVMSKGATTCGNKFQSAICGDFGQDTAKGPKGGHMAMAIARVTLIRTEA